MYEYGSDFYSFLSSFALRSARAVVPIVASGCPTGSVVDFGCGQGAWLSIWKAAGAEIMGVDGPYVAQDRLLIPAASFRPSDLALPIDLGRRFDLVQSLETAEHIPSHAARDFVATLVRHGDAILFSAAVPGQGGEHHVNEQPLAYWRGLFAAHDYRPVDLVRPALRDKSDVQSWYRYNTVLYVNAAGMARLSADARGHLVSDGQPLDVGWPLASRMRQGMVRILPDTLVNRLSRLNASLLARKAARQGAPAGG